MPQNVLIVDALSLFTRAFCVFPSMNGDGEQFGGCIGFLKILRKIVNESRPDAIYIAWEGGGSQRRRALYPLYKQNRKPEKLNRFYEDDIPETGENRQMQIIKLLEFLKCMPVCQLYVANCEADDVIAHLCCGPLRDIKKTIASSDKDFYQLLNEKTQIYNLHKKTYVTHADVYESFKITSQNFAVAKALCGDISDNIPGIKGMGFKTVIKRFPFLGTDNDVSLQDVFDYCHSHVDETPIYKRIIEAEDDVRRNWKLMYLNGGMLSASQVSVVDNIINTFAPKIDKMRFIKNLVKEGVGDFDAHNYLESFMIIDGLHFKV